MHPGTLYYTANAFNRTDTVKPLWEEVAIVKPQLVKYMEAHPDGIHLICYSQGTFCEKQAAHGPHRSLKEQFLVSFYNSFLNILPISCC